MGFRASRSFWSFSTPLCTNIGVGCLVSALYTQTSYVGTQEQGVVTASAFQLGLAQSTGSSPNTEIFSNLLAPFFT